jgi:tungstate transport system permease protein
VTFLWDGFRHALTLIRHPTSDLRSIVAVSLKLAISAALLALLIGVPIGAAMGRGHSRTQRAGVALANGGLGLPPVVVGLFVALLMFRQGPLGGMHLIYTLRGMILAQTVLDLPIVIALTAAAVHALDPGLLDQARALGASRTRTTAFAIREAKAGIFVAGIAAVGAGLSEVGAVVLVGGNIQGTTRTMAGAILTTISSGHYDDGIAIGVLLLGWIFLLAASLTAVQQLGASRAEADRMTIIGRR